MRFLRRSLMGLFLLSLTIALFVWAGILMTNAFMVDKGGGGPRSEEERVFTANVIRIEGRTLNPILTTFGEVRSRRTLEVRATVGGTVLELSPNFEEGGLVSAGERLVAIDPSDAQSALATAQNDMSEAEAGVREAERALLLIKDQAAATENQAALQARALERARDLAERGVGSVAAVETAELANAQSVQAVLSDARALAQAEGALDQARALVARRQITLTEAERALAKTKITAEFAGTLAQVSAVEGGLVTPNERLAQLIDRAALEVSFRLSTSQYARLLGPDGRLQNAAVHAVLDVFGADLTATGTINRESGAVGEGQTGRLLFATLTDTVGFRPGDFVTVSITEPAQEDVALLPATALDGSGTLLALGEEDRLEAFPVTILRRQGDDVIILATGLEGRDVVTERSPFLGVGIKVRPIRSGVIEPLEPEMIELTAERRAALVAFVENNTRMPEEAKARLLAQLNAPLVPVDVITRLESRMGG